MYNIGISIGIREVIMSISRGRFNKSFEGRFEKEFGKFELCDRCWSLVRDKVSREFIWRFVDGIVEVNDYRWVFGDVLLKELRLFWLEEKRSEG